MNAITAPRMGFGLGSRLSFMMFLQYAIWGAWLPLLLSYMLDVLKFSPGQIGPLALSLNAARLNAM